MPLLLVALCASCHDDLPLPDSGLRRVVIVYMMGENTLSSQAQSDLNEIRSATGLIPDSCRVVVFFDNSRTDIKPQILSYDKTGERLLFEYGTDVVSTDSATMLNALSYIIESVEADEYALVLWSHGSGWMPASRSIGVDNGRNSSTSDTGTEMEITTLRGVLEELGVRWRYILYDACFMQCVEVAYELRGLTEWSIGSPAEIPGSGAAYDRMMSCFFARDGFAGDIAEQYFNTYKDTQGVLVSAIRSDRLDGLAQATARVLSPLFDFPTGGVQQYCAYDERTGWKPEYYDIGSCVYHWAGQDGYDEWLTAMEAAIPYRYCTDTWMSDYAAVFHPVMTDEAHYAGASMYVPFDDRDTYNKAWRRYEWYQAAGRLLDR